MDGERLNSTMNKNTTILAAAAAFAAAMGAALTANAGTVNNSVNKDDPRYMTTGCKYEGAFASGAGSIGIWVKNVTEHANPAAVFGSCHVNTGTSDDQGMLLFINGSGDFGFRVAGSKNGAVSRQSATASGSSALRSDGAWHFLLGTFDKASGKMNLYIDGESAGSVDIDIDSFVPARCFTIAAIGLKDESTTVQKSSYAAGFRGLYAEATLWDKALTAEEVAALASRRAYPWDDGLIGYWPLAKNSANLAQGATKRADGSRPGALCYVRQVATDASFFDNPPTRFVASEEWVAENNYSQPAGASFSDPDSPATNATEAVAAVDAAGHAVWLMPGTHRISASVKFAQENLTVVGKYPGSDGDCALLDAQGLCRHFVSSERSGGCSGFAVRDLVLANGHASSDGGSIYVVGRTGIVERCVFRDNSADGSGGAVYTQQSGEAWSHRCTFFDCVFSNNVAATQGGAVRAMHCIELDGCRFDGNTTSGGSDTRGGHASIGKFSRFSGSSFAGACSATYGGCIEVDSSSVTITNCVFSGLSPSASYGVVHTTASSLSFIDCIFTNISTDISLFFPEGGNASILFRQCLFGQDAGSGSLVTDFGGKTRFENCTMAKTLFDNKRNSSAENVLVNCVAPNADISSSGAYVNILTNSLVKSVSGGTLDSGVMTGNPKFVDVAAGDYRLAATSPCREKGLPLGWMTAGATDLDGNPRLVNLLGKTAVDAIPDLGCYECQEVGIQPTVLSMR